MALLCEDIVNGMIAAKEFRNTSSSDPALPNTSELLSRNDQRTVRPRHPEIEVIIDIANRDWDFKVQAGTFSILFLQLLSCSTLPRGTSTSRDEHIWQCAEIYPIRVHNAATQRQGVSNR